MAQEGNVYGIQKVPETQRSGDEDAKIAGTSMAQGMKAGSSYGPWGALIGGVIGGAKGIIQADSASAKQFDAMRDEKAHNAFVDNLSGRQLKNTNLVRAQARYGMKTNKYEKVEIEGDGSGDLRHGIGEIHVDKKYNIKNVAKGSPTHEEGGHKINIKKGDTVFPTQNSKEEYDNVMDAIKRYKVNGDKRAKKYLDLKKASLPTDEDYGYADKKEYPKGVNYDEAYKEALATIPEVDQDREEKAKNILSMNGWDIANKTKAEDKKVDSKKEDAWETKSIKGDPYQYRRRYNQDGKLELQTKKGAGDWKDIEEGVKNKNTWDKEAPKVSGSVTEKRIFGNALSKPSPAPAEIPAKEGPSPDLTPKELNKTAFPYEKPEMKKLPTVTQTGDSTIPSTGVTEKKEEMFPIKNEVNPLKYASAINNFITGISPVEKTTRRYYTPDEYKYADRSAAQRRAALEQRNFSGNQLRGKGLSMGQQQGYMGQVASRYLAANEDINEREAQRNDSIDQANTAMFNDAKQQNLGLANQYDVMDSQNRAARKAYLDRAFADVSELAQYDEQKRYMKQKDERQFDIQEKTIPLVGTEDFKYEGEDWNKVELSEEARQREMQRARKYRYGKTTKRYK